MKFSLVVCGLILWSLAAPLVAHANDSGSTGSDEQSRDTETCIYRGCGRRDKV